MKKKEDLEQFELDILDIFEYKPLENTPLE
jgi:hypothetical protein